MESAQTSALNKRMYLVSSSMPVEGFENFIQAVRTKPNMGHVRFLFDLDKTGGDYSHIFQKDLVLSILKNGQWLTSVNQSINYKDNVTNRMSSQDSSNNKQYLSLNLEDETLGVQISNNNIGNIDYSGIDNSGKKIMGLAQIDVDSSNIKIDPIFAWEIPESWSLQDAVTVPHAYLSVSNSEITQVCEILLLKY